MSGFYNDEPGRPAGRKVSASPASSMLTDRRQWTVVRGSAGPARFAAKVGEIGDVQQVMKFRDREAFFAEYQNAPVPEPKRVFFTLADAKHTLGLAFPGGRRGGRHPCRAGALGRPVPPAVLASGRGGVLRVG